ncbi:MAG: protease modulator HflC [Deltaproteobacteria bacterium]|jgi:membrane protease subunit HflC|nr:protease modulator HflC [Deltaproteobacteria bacterium]
MKFSTLAIGLVVIYLVLSALFFTVDQTQRAIVLQFGQPVGDVREPGLHIKIPIIQKVVSFENRLMEYDVAAAEIYSGDKKNLVVDAFVRWRIDDPLLFYQRFKSENSYSIIEEAKSRLGGIIVGELRRELGLHNMADIISQNRGSIMEIVTDNSNRKLAEDTNAGLTVIDVRIKKADLPPQNQRAVYDRMRTEREQQATKYRSEGRRNGQMIMAQTDRSVRETLALAERKSQIIRGEADSEAAGIYAQAFGQDPEFYSFKRSLESYQTVLGDRSVILLDPANMDYLKYLGRTGEYTLPDVLATAPPPELYALPEDLLPDLSAVPEASSEGVPPAASPAVSPGGTAPAASPEAAAPAASPEGAAPAASPASPAPAVSPEAAAPAPNR